MESAGAKKVRPASVEASAIEFARLRRGTFGIGRRDVEPVINDPVELDRFLADDRFRLIVPAGSCVIEGPNRHRASVGNRAADVDVDLAVKGLQCPDVTG